MTLNTEARALAAQINKKMGDGTVVVASEMAIPEPFTTGSLALDIALGGGFAGNQWAEVIGLQSHGKTAVTLKTIAANQARDPEFTTLWIAGEHYDRDQAAALGVDNERVIVVPTQDMTFAYDTVLDFAESKSTDCFVIDSYPALIAPEEEEKTMDDVQVALGARITGKFFRKMGSAGRRAPDGSERPFLGLFINQYRDKIGAFSPHGTPKTTPGGNAKNYAFYQQVEVKRDEWIEEAIPGKNLKVKVGQTIKCKTVKNKAAAPQQVASMDFYFRDAPQHGFLRGEYDQVKELITYGLLYDIIDRKGAYFNIGDQIRVQGKDPLIEHVRQDLDLREYLDREIRQVALHTGAREITEEAIEKAESAGKKTVKRKAKATEEVDLDQAS